jgi:ATP-binding cassette subfamily F protein 3
MIALNNVTKQYGSRILYQGASVQINPGEKIGLVGPNGAGKTTVFRVITGEEGVDAGAISKPDKIVIGYFSQSTGEMKGRSALEEVEAGAGKVSVLAARLSKLEKELQETSVTPISDDAMTKLLEEYGEVQLEYEQRGGYDLNSRAKEILTGLGIGPDAYDNPVETFSGGWKMRIALAKILVLNPDALLMDEPTNHLDLESILWLEEWLKNFKGSLVMTSHDREFMSKIVSRIVEVANKAITSYGGNYDFYLREKDIRMAQLLASHRKQTEMLAKEEEFISRFAARASHAAQVQSRVKKLDKIDRIEIPTEEATIEFTFPEIARSGNEVVKLENVEKKWPLVGGGERTVFTGINGMIRRTDKVALVGVNGAGKSTILKIMAEQTEATGGKATIGANVKVGYFSQHSLEILNPKNTIYDEVYSRIPNASVSYVRSLCGAFLFSGDDVFKKISVLSGGEKSRVVLATLLANPMNFLILDEPTNHLDIKSREVLLKALQDFAGTVILVSHDRFFLKALATRVFELDHGEMQVFEGNYEYYLTKTHKQAH